MTDALLPMAVISIVAVIGIIVLIKYMIKMINYRRNLDWKPPENKK
jgi:hypothetical protein